jgi:hypothetical protein
MMTTSFPKLKSAGAEGARIAGRDRLIHVTVNVSKGTKEKPTSTRHGEGPGKHERKIFIPKE